MKLDLFRSLFGPNSTPGKLAVEGMYDSRTLELPWRDNQPQISCIPAGVYPIVITESPHLKRNTPELLNVPGRDCIRIHIANYPHELLGCIAVGHEAGVDTVAGSTSAFLDLYEKIDNALKSGDSVTLEIHDPVAA